MEEHICGRLRIFSLDGRLRYTSDSSLGFGERESHHPVTGRIDSEVANRFVGDVLDHPEAPTFSELVRLVKLVVVENRESALGLKSIIELLKPKEPHDKENGVVDRPFYVG